MMVRIKDSAFAAIADNLVSLRKRELINSFPNKKEELCLPHALPQAGRKAWLYKDEKKTNWLPGFLPLYLPNDTQMIHGEFEPLPHPISALTPQSH